jgi:hypothetical protein
MSLAPSQQGALLTTVLNQSLLSDPRMTANHLKEKSMKKISKVTATPRFATEQLASANVETKLMPPYLRYNVPAERAQIEAIIRAARKEWALASPPQADQGTLVYGLLVASEPSGPPRGGGLASSLASAAVFERRVATRGIENLPPAQPTTKNPAIQTGTSAAKMATAPASIVPDGVVSLGWYCPTEFKVHCATGQTGTGYIWHLWCGSEPFFLGRNNNGTLYFHLDGNTYNLGAKASNGTLQVKVVCEIVPRDNPKGYTIDLPVTLNFVNQPPCISLKNALFPEEQVPCELVGDDHGQRPKIRVNLTAPAGPGGQTVFLFLNDPHPDNPVGRWLNPGIDSFVIPFGQTSGEWQGFLGTRKVTSDKTISIRARVNTQESQPLTIKVKRKKKN